MLAAARRATLPLPAHARTYAVAVGAPTRFGHKTGARVYDERKTFLYNAYARLFAEARGAPLVFLHHKDFKAGRLIKLRRDLADAVDRQQRAAAGPAPVPAARPKISMLTSGLFGAALRDHAPLDAAAVAELAALIPGGGLAVLTLPSLDPPQLHAILRALERSVPPVKQLSPADAAAARKAAADAAAKSAVPGRRAKRVRTAHTPELRVLGAIIDGRVFAAPGIKTISALPTLDTLRAQLVGLLSAPAAQLAGVLSQASGGQLARTLDGFKKGLEDAQVEPPAAN